MNLTLHHLLIYLASFIAVWWGSGLVVSSVSKLAYGLKLPAFVVSFFILGVLTSLPEAAIGLTAISTDDPSIFVGNLIGGSIVLFLFVIPLLGLLNNGVKVPLQLNKFVLVTVLLVIFLPTAIIRDRVIESWEAIVSVLIYMALFMFFSKEQSVVEKLKHTVKIKRSINIWDILRIVGGVAILFVGSNKIVDSTLFFADLFGLAPFFVSLIVVALGTNIPEISLVFRSMFLKNQDVALADYMGSAAANTLLFGSLSLIYGKEIMIPNHYYHRLIFIIVALLLMFFFMRSKNRLSKVECAFLLILYVIFVITELLLI